MPAITHIKPLFIITLFSASATVSSETLEQIYQEYKPAPIEANETINNIVSRDVNEPGFIEFMHENGIAQWPVKQWNFEEITLTALYFNPQIQAKFSEFKLNEAQSLTLLQRKNPVVSVPVEHHSESRVESIDNSDETSPWTIGLLFDFVLERPAKRQAKQDKVDAEIQAALINVKKSIWDLRSKLKLAWIEYTSALILNNFIKDESKLLEDRHVILLRQHELGESSYFELSNTRLETILFQGMSMNQVS